MAQPSEKLPAITKTTKVSRRFVPESEVERVVDEVSERIRSQSNAMLAEQAAAAHLLKYKAKKSRRQAAHLKIQNNKLKQAVEEEQLKFKKLKEALKRRTEQYDKLRVDHSDLEEKVKRQTNKIEKLRKQLSAARLEDAQGSTIRSDPAFQTQHGTHSRNIHQMETSQPTHIDTLPPSDALIRRTAERPRAVTPQYNNRPARNQGLYTFRPSSAPDGGRDMGVGASRLFDLEPRPGTSDSFATQQSHNQSGTDESEEEGHIQQSFGTTRFVEGVSDGGLHKVLVDSSGQEFTDEDVDPRNDGDEREHLENEVGEDYDDFPAVGNHIDFPPRPESLQAHVDPLDAQRHEGSFTSSHTGGNDPRNARPASSPPSRSGAPPLHRGPIADVSLLSQGSHRMDNSMDSNRPSTAPDEIYNHMPGNSNALKESLAHMSEEQRENAEIDMFLDEGDRLRPNSAPAGSSPKRKKKFFPKRVPKKRDNAQFALDEDRRRKEQEEADAIMRMQSLKKTWLRAIHEEPSTHGIDKFAYKKKKKWLCLAVCQGIICTHSAPRRHICFGLTLVLLVFCGTLRAYASNKAFGYYVAAADFAICMMGFMSYTGMYYVVSAGNNLKRILTFVFHENRHRTEIQDLERRWRYYVAPGTQFAGGLIAVAYVALTVLKSVSILDELDIMMMIIGSLAIVWFSILISHFIGLFWFAQYAAIIFIRENSPMHKKKDPAVEDFFRIKRIVDMLADSFGNHLVLPLGLVSFIGVVLCSFGIGRSNAGEMPLELTLLGIFFTAILHTLLKTSGGITREVNKLFSERTMHTLELIKGFEEIYSKKLMEMSGNSINDLLVSISNRTLKYHNMMFTLFATGGDGKDTSISFSILGITIRPMYSLATSVFCVASLLCAIGIPGFGSNSGQYANVATVAAFSPSSS